MKTLFYVFAGIFIGLSAVAAIAAFYRGDPYDALWPVMAAIWAGNTIILVAAL